MKLTRVLILLVGLIACSDIVESPNEPLHPQVRAITSTETAPTASRFDVFFGPETFTRRTDKPLVVVRTIDATGYQGPFTVRLRNGDAAGDHLSSSARVLIDGAVIFGPSDFNQQIRALTKPVTLTTRSTLTVEQSGSPGSQLTISVEGQPIGVQSITVNPDPTRAVTATIPVGGGTIEAAAVNGTKFVLAIPPNALIAQTAITLTPIANVSGLRSRAQFLGAVRMAPEGLSFLEPATLTITFPTAVPVTSLLAFGSASSGTDFHFAPALVTPTSLSISLGHFSNAGGVLDNCALSSSTSLSWEARTKQQITCVLQQAGYPLNELSDADVLLIEGYLNEWYEGAVRPLGASALTCANIQCPGVDAVIRVAINEYLLWQNTIQIALNFGLIEATFQQKSESEEARFAETLNILTANLDAQCVALGDHFTEQVALVGRIVALRVYVDALGIGNTVLLESICQGALAKIVQKIEVIPTSATLELGQTVNTVRATVTNVLGEVMPNARVVWHASAPTTASVTPTGDSTSAPVVVTALTRGTANITASRDDKSGSGVFTVNSVQSIVLSERDVTLNPDATMQITALVLSSSGATLSSDLLNWDSSNETVATVDRHGLITALNGGEAKVSAKLDGVEAVVNVTTTGTGPARIRIEPAWITVRPGETVALRAVVEDSDGAELTGYAVTWQSGNLDRVTVSASGPLTATATSAGPSGWASAMAHLPVLTGVTAIGVRYPTLAERQGPRAGRYSSSETNWQTCVVQNGSTMSFFSPYGSQLGTAFSSFYYTVSAADGEFDNVVTVPADTTGTVFRRQQERYVIAGDRISVTGVLQTVQLVDGSEVVTFAMILPATVLQQRSVGGPGWLGSFESTDSRVPASGRWDVLLREDCVSNFNQLLNVSGEVLVGFQPGGAPAYFPVSGSVFKTAAFNSGGETIRLISQFPPRGPQQLGFTFAPVSFAEINGGTMSSLVVLDAVPGGISIPPSLQFWWTAIR